MTILLTQTEKIYHILVINNKRKNKMIVRNIKANVTEVDTEVDTQEYTILISYSTPVAARQKDTGNEYVTETRWSNTTTRHIRKWCRTDNPVRMPQEWLERKLQ